MESGFNQRGDEGLVSMSDALRPTWHNQGLFFEDPSFVSLANFLWILAVGLSAIVCRAEAFFFSCHANHIWNCSKLQFTVGRLFKS